MTPGTKKNNGFVFQIFDVIGNRLGMRNFREEVEVQKLVLFRVGSHKLRRAVGALRRIPFGLLEAADASWLLLAHALSTTRDACAAIAAANGSAPAESVAAALDAVRWSVQLVLDRDYASWSLENVATPGVVACLRDLAQQHPTRVAFMVLDAADYGVPSSRVRLIASTPEAIRALKEVPVRRVSVAEAFSVAGVPLPSDWIKSNTTNRDGSPCVRSVRRHPARCPPHISSRRTLTHAAATPLRQVQQPSFTVTASHPLIWARRDGTTVRCLTVAESAVLMGFAPGWKLPSGSRAGLRAVGNAVPPPLACAVMTAASGRAHAPEALPPPSPESPSTSSEEPPLPATTLAELQGSVRRIKRRLDELERRAEPARVP